MAFPLLMGQGGILIMSKHHLLVACSLPTQEYPCSYQVSLTSASLPLAATTSNSDWVKLKWRNCPSISPGTVPMSPSPWSHFSIHFQSRLWHIQHVPLRFYSSSQSLTARDVPSQLWWRSLETHQSQRSLLSRLCSTQYLTGYHRQHVLHHHIP